MGTVTRQGRRTPNVQHVARTSPPPPAARGRCRSAAPAAHAGAKTAGGAHDGNVQGQNSALASGGRRLRSAHRWSVAFSSLEPGGELPRARRCLGETDGPTRPRLV
ncbi:hypothetical protein ABZP36_005478 [Zizania latifolia]